MQPQPSTAAAVTTRAHGKSRFQRAAAATLRRRRVRFSQDRDPPEFMEVMQRSRGLHTTWNVAKPHLEINQSTESSAQMQLAGARTLEGRSPFDQVRAGCSAIRNAHFFELLFRTRTLFLINRLLLSIAMGLDLLPILPRALPSGSAVAVVGQRVRLQLHCQNGRFFLLIQCL
jgi:hypothetical protein